MKVVEMEQNCRDGAEREMESRVPIETIEEDEKVKFKIVFLDDFCWAFFVFLRLGVKPKRSLEIILFTSEEPTRFGISCLGSCLLAGSKELTEVLKTTIFDGQNVSFIEAARSTGYAEDKDDDLSSVFLKKGSYCFVCLF
ncbi:hypothetical protein ARALYDRAFT_915174 [Arabidopsis lyrata subsp. lyrata]|uniref:Uncharacterized protein n=1 Tax=Arabidopsis lyrata subsp. lyrata TaxID=81972 RepID=D7MA97_ARALL|nr:hypothetical protein ARALYDRAFT_915174 [Arabidopsis lyrata subsp. lyrata]